MLLSLTAIAIGFVGIWVVAVAIKFRLRPISKRNQKAEIALPELSVSLISLLLFLFAPTRFINLSHTLKFEPECHREADNHS